MPRAIDLDGVPPTPEPTDKTAEQLRAEAQELFAEAERMLATSARQSSFMVEEAMREERRRRESARTFAPQEPLHQGLTVLELLDEARRVSRSPDWSPNRNIPIALDDTVLGWVDGVRIVMSNYLRPGEIRRVGDTIYAAPDSVQALRGMLS